LRASSKNALNWFLRSNQIEDCKAWYNILQRYGLRAYRRIVRIRFTAFERGDLKIHLGVETDFRPARKADVALLVADLRGLQEKLRASGYALKEDQPLEGFHRIYVDDPFGNRIELMEPLR